MIFAIKDLNFLKKTKNYLIKIGKKYSFFSRKFYTTKSTSMTRNYSRRVMKIIDRVINFSNLVFYVLDSRYIINGLFLPKQKIFSGEPRWVLVINKTDLIPKYILQIWKKAFSKLFLVICSHFEHNFRPKKREILNIITQLFRKLKNRNNQVNVGILGPPGVGKSTLIKFLCKKDRKMQIPRQKSTHTWQFYKITKNIYCIDSPGININLKKSFKMLNYGQEKFTNIKDQIKKNLLKKNHPYKELIHDLPNQYLSRNLFSNFSMKSKYSLVLKTTKKLPGFKNCESNNYEINTYLSSPVFRVHYPKKSLNCSIWKLFINFSKLIPA